MLEYSRSAARDELNSLLVRVGWADIASRLFANGGRGYVMAGAVRDALASCEFGLDVRAPRDLDIGIEDVSIETFESVCFDLGAVKNRFGGFRLELPDSFQLDVWRLENTISLRRRRSPYS